MNINEFLASRNSDKKYIVGPVNSATLIKYVIKKGPQKNTERSAVLLSVRTDPNEITGANFLTAKSPYTDFMINEGDDWFAAASALYHGQQFLCEASQFTKVDGRAVVRMDKMVGYDLPDGEEYLYYVDEPDNGDTAEDIG